MGNLETIIVPLPDNSSRKDYRLFYDKENFIVQEYNEYNNGWYPANKDPDDVISNMDFEPQAICNFVKIIESIKPQYNQLAGIYPNRKIAMLSLLHANNHFEELLQTTTSLGAMLCNHYGRQKHSLDEAKALIDNPRNEILGSLLGVYGKSHVRIMSHYKEKEYDDEKIKTLSEMLISETALDIYRKSQVTDFDHILASLLVSNKDNEIWNFPSYHKFIKYHYIVNMDSFRELAFMTSISEMNRQIDNIHWLAEELKINNLDFCLNQCKTYFDLFDLHRKWTKKFEKIRLNNIILTNKDAFNTPPYKGTKEIIPIENIRDLYEEAKTMRNCVSEYYDKIMNGEYYVYKVLAPERATLGIKILKYPDQKLTVFQVDDVRLAKNDKASEQTRDAIRKWFIQENRTN